MNRYAIIVFWSDADEAWVADVPDLEPCAAHGDTPEKALPNCASRAAGRLTDIGRPRFAAEELCCEVRKVLGERSEGLKHLFCIPRAIYGLNQLIVERFVREENCALSLHARNRRMDVVR